MIKHIPSVKGLGFQTSEVRYCHNLVSDSRTARFKWNTKLSEVTRFSCWWLVTHVWCWDMFNNKIIRWSIVYLVLWAFERKGDMKSEAAETAPAPPTTAAATTAATIVVTTTTTTTTTTTSSSSSNNSNSNSNSSSNSNNNNNNNNINSNSNSNSNITSNNNHHHPTNQGWNENKHTHYDNNHKDNKSVAQQAFSKALAAGSHVDFPKASDLRVKSVAAERVKHNIRLNSLPHSAEVFKYSQVRGICTTDHLKCLKVELILMSLMLLECMQHFQGACLAKLCGCVLFSFLQQSRNRDSRENCHLNHLNRYCVIGEIHNIFFR